MIIKRFEQQVEKHSNKPAVKTENGLLTYKELDIFSNKIANKIKAIKTGKNSSGNIGLLMDDARAMIASILGVLKAGHTYVSLVADFPGKRIAYIIRHAEIEIFITDDKNKERVLRAADNENKKDICLVRADEIAGAGGGETLEFRREVCEDSDAYLLYTSGSSGLPKAVRQTHRGILHFVDRCTETLELTSRDHLTLFSSFSHDAAVMDIYSSLLNGATLFPLDLKKSGIFDRLPQWLNQEQITVWHSVPTVYRYFASSLTDKPDLPHLRFVVLGGEAVLKSDIKKFFSFFRHCRLYNLYGQTESTYNSGQFFEADRPVDDPAITLGEAVSGTEIVVVDEEGNEVEPLEVGEILVVSEHVSPGYWRDDAGTREKFSETDSGERMYFTGDLGRPLMDGRIEFLGRKDNQVKIRGYRVELGEVEGAAMQYDMVTQAAAVTVENPSGEPYIALYFAARKNIDLNSLREFLQESLPDYMVPAYFKQLEKLPVTVSGKIDRKSLPALDVTLGREYAAPRSEIEKKLVEIWAELLQLGRDVIGINNSFFELGGHSLKAVVLTSKLHREFNVQVPLAVVFDRPFIKDLAQYIAQAGGAEYEGISAAEEKEYYPVSSVQKRMYLIQQLEKQGTTYNIPNFFHLGGYADRERLEETFKKLIRRHEILRTGFIMKDQEPVQRVHAPDKVNFVLGFHEASLAEAPAILNQFIAPFDLSQAPLFRAALLKVDGNCRLMFDFHHIIVDNASLNLLEADYLALYEGLELPGVKLHYKDYSQWQNSKSRQETLNRQGEYWLKPLEGELPVIDLPADHPRPSMQSFEGRTTHLILKEKETKILKKMAQDMDATLYMVLLAAFNVLLFRLSSQEDILVGMPMAARPHAELQDIIGMFVNTLVMRNYPWGEKPFSDFLKEVKQNTIAAYENQEYPLEDLVDRLSIRRDASRNPLFDAMFNLLDERGYQFEISEEVEDEAPVYQKSTSRLDLTLTTIDREHRLLFRFEFSTRLFAPQTMTRFIGYFKNILLSLASDPEIKLADMDILSEEEKKRILELCSEGWQELHPGMTLHRLFEEQAEKTPGGVAVVGSWQLAVGKEMRNGETLQLTYMKLNQKSDQVARVLKEKGALADDIIGIMVERSIEMIIGILGILKAGGAYMPIDADYPQERIDFMLKDSGAKLLVTDNKEGEKVRRWEGKIYYIEESLCSSYPLTFLPSYLQNSSNPATSLAYVLYTSGTTGRPKGVMVTHRNVVRLVKKANFTALGQGTRLLQTGPLEFDASTFEIWGPLLNGGILHVTVKQDILTPQTLKRMIRDYRINTMWMTSPLFNQMVDIDTGIFAGLETLLVGGDTLSPTHIDRIRERFPLLTVINGYGPTENTTFSAVFRIDRKYEKNIPIGRPIGNSTVFILDRSFNLVPIGAAGELAVGGDGTARGYLNDPELTAEKFVRSVISHSSFVISSSESVTNDQCPMTNDRLYRTGDLARWLHDGNLEFLGRMDYQVKIRGFRVETGEIESRLRSHSGIKETVVAAREDEKGNKYLCAYIVPVKNEQLPFAELQEYLSKGLPDYMIPSHFVSLENMPLTANGKIDRKRLPTPGLEVMEEYTAPGNPLEEKLAHIWSEVLAVPLERMSIHANFFKLGGQSLKATQIAARLEKEGYSVPISHIFIHPTIGQLAEHIDQSIKQEEEDSRANMDEPAAAE